MIKNRRTLLSLIRLSGLLLCFGRYVLKCIYACFNLGINPGIDVTKVLVDVVFDVFT